MNGWAVVQTAGSVNNLGTALQDLGDLTGARAAYECALWISRATPPSDHSSIRTVQREVIWKIRTVG